MSVRSIFVERLPMHPLLGRNVYLDSMSKMFAVQPTSTPVASIRHAAFIGILDQGQVGSCTGNASCSCAYHAPFFSAQALIQPWENQYTPDETGAQSWYHDNTANDSYAGTWEPDDTGSDGLTSSKMAVKAGVASGYQAALDLDSSLQQLMKVPGITGIPYYNSMFDAPSSGLLTVTPSSGLAGGHELCVDEIVAADAPGNGTGKLLVGGPNSWGSSWGAQGRWYLTGADWWELRKNNGDVYYWVPSTSPAPTPTPVPEPSTAADADLWDATGPFRADHHVVPHIVAAVHGLNAWGSKKGFQA
jgi:hypothetical protein